MSPDSERPSSRRLSASADRSELRQALRRDLISWHSSEIYLVGEDGPMEGRPAADGTPVLWTENGRWFVDHSERGSIGTEYAYVFGSEAEACRWLYDRAYLSRYETAGRVYLRYLDEIGDQETSTAVRRHQSAIQALSKSLAEHPRNQPPPSGA